MKPILIDNLVSDASENQSGQTVVVDGMEYNGWQIAKLLNYDPEYFSYKDRIEMAIEVLNGRAIAVRYFDDLSEEEKVEYVKDKISSSSDSSTLSNE